MEDWFNQLRYTFMKKYYAAIKRAKTIYRFHDMLLNRRQGAKKVYLVCYLFVHIFFTSLKKKDKSEIKGSGYLQRNE